MNKFMKEEGKWYRATARKADTEGRSVKNLLETIWYKRWRCLFKKKWIELGI